MIDRQFRDTKGTQNSEPDSFEHSLEASKSASATAKISSVEPHQPPRSFKAVLEAAFFMPRKNGDTKGTQFLKAIKRMRAPSEPKIDKSNDQKWFIHWNHDVPFTLWESYKRKRIRIKVYENINRYKGLEREEYAQQLVAKYKLLLHNLKYNPFEEELNVINPIIEQSAQVEQKILVEEQRIIENQKAYTNIQQALDEYLQSRIERTDNTNSHSTHRGVIKWFKKYLSDHKLTDLNVSEITRQHIANALLYAKKNQTWNPTTYNSNIDLIMTAFNWFEIEEYILKNPAKGKIQKVKATVGKHKWYKKDIAEKIKLHMINHEQRMVYNACAFTYHLCVRSQQELLKLKVEDIDFRLKRIRFRKEVSKNGIEAYRDFSPEFEQVALSMKLDKKPQHFYIFGSGGEPSEKMAGKNSLSMPYKKVKDHPKVKLNDDYTIYGWKHTRVIHEMMKGTDVYQIQHLCRHSSIEETQKYMRGFDISLRNVYDPEDLTF